MSYARTFRNSQVALWFAKLIVATTIGLVLASVILLAGCASTVAPKPVSSETASWDGTNQNSGLIGMTPDRVFIITSHARDRYNALAAIWGQKHVPPIVPDVGLVKTETNTWLMDAQRMEYFATMNRWAKNAFRP